MKEEERGSELEAKSTGEAVAPGWVVLEGQQDNPGSARVELQRGGGGAGLVSLR